MWCQDYHVMLLPLMLKEAVPEMKLGWFLHTPFPSSEIYRALPLREEILRGVLAADLVGFHTVRVPPNLVPCRGVCGDPKCQRPTIQRSTSCFKHRFGSPTAPIVPLLPSTAPSACLHPAV